MYLHATKEIQVQPYDRGKLDFMGFKIQHDVDGQSSGSSKVSLDHLHFLESKDNSRPDRKRDQMPKIERELSDAYIDTITRTPRYGLGRHKTYDEILLSMSTDDPFGKNYQPPVAKAKEENAMQKSPDKNTTSSLNESFTKVKHKTESHIKTNSSSDKKDKILKKVSVSKDNVKNSSEKQIQTLHSNENVVKVDMKSRKHSREKSSVSVSNKRLNKSKRKTSLNENKVKRTLPRKSRIPVYVNKPYDRASVFKEKEFEFKPSGIKKVKNSRIPVMKKYSLSDIEKRRALSASNQRWKARQKIKKHPEVFIPSKSPQFTANSTFGSSSSPERSTESNIFGSTFGSSPWRRAGSVMETSSTHHSLYPLNHGRSGISTPDIDYMSNKLKSTTLKECDYKELKEITSLAFGQRSKTMFDDYKASGLREIAVTPKHRDNLPPKMERELSDAYIESLSRTPRYGLGRHKTYDEILTSMSQADPFNGNYQPSGISPRQKSNISMQNRPDTYNASENIPKTKSKG